MKLITPEDCGNAPKKEFLRDFNIAFAKNDSEEILKRVTDDITWEIVGDKIVHGKEQFAQVLDSMQGSKATELIIKTIITHGDEGSINGVMVFSSESSIAFCDVCTFSSHGKDALIKEMTSYAVELVK